MAWFESHLAALRAHKGAPNLSVSLHVTRGAVLDAGATSSPASEPVSPVESPSSEKAASLGFGTATTKEHSDFDPEKQSAAGAALGTSASETGAAVTAFDSRPELLRRASSGRPNVSTLIRSAVREAGPGKTVLVAACGPKGLMSEVRKTVAECIGSGGASVELHCESFEW